MWKIRDSEILHFISLIYNLNKLNRNLHVILHSFSYSSAIFNCGFFKYFQSLTYQKIHLVLFAEACSRRHPGSNNAWSYCASLANTVHWKHKHLNQRANVLTEKSTPLLSFSESIDLSSIVIYHLVYKLSFERAIKKGTPGKKRCERVKWSNLVGQLRSRRRNA